MKRLLFISALAFSMSALAQDSNRNYNRFQLGVMFSPEISTGFYTDQNERSLFKFSESRADWKPGFTTGIKLCHNASAVWGFEIGIQYSNMGYQNTYSELTFGDYIGGNRRYSPPDPPIASYNRRQTYHYLGIPLRVILTAGKRNLSFVTGFGLVSNFLLKVTEINTLKLEHGDTRRDSYEILNEFNTFSLEPTISVGLNYRLGELISLRLEPNVRYALINTGSFKEFSRNNEHLVSLGLSFTCYVAL